MGSNNKVDWTHIATIGYGYTTIASEIEYTYFKVEVDVSEQTNNWFDINYIVNSAQDVLFYREKVLFPKER